MSEYYITYNCPECKHKWHDVYECAADDNCPNCGLRHISPIEWEEIGPVASSEEVLEILRDRYVCPNPCSLKEAEKILATYKIELIYDETIPSWFLAWTHGTISLQGGDEPTAKCTAALFAVLYKIGIDCGLARDLACSYFDRRIGRTIYKE